MRTHTALVGCYYTNFSKSIKLINQYIVVGTSNIHINKILTLQNFSEKMYFYFIL